MATPSQFTANQANAHASTGPRTESGKERSSQNAITLGLFTIRDFVRPEEQNDFEQLGATLASELNPVGVLEETYVAAIVGATWRLRRCSLVEAGIVDSCGLEPMQDQIAARLQLSVDRARAQAHNILRRSLAELRRLQTDRTIREEIYDGAPVPPVQDMTSHKDVVIALNHADRGKLLAKKLDELDSVASIMDRQLGSSPIEPALGSSKEPELGSFCKNPGTTAINTPRNAPCPCRSGLKYKRCCGKLAPPALAEAA
jgi:DNA-directed RNA polymerase subunit K/omega